MSEAWARGLFLRIISALVLATATLAAVQAGPPYFGAFVTAAAIIMAWEWGRLCGDGTFNATGAALILVIAATSNFAAFGEPEVALVMTMAAPLPLIVLARLLHHPHPYWVGLAGVPYLSLPVIAVHWLYLSPASGPMTLLWLLMIVWATDTAAYFAGKLIGGPLLAPSISPKKTWAGLGGAMVGAAAAGVAVGLIGGASLSVSMIAVIAMILAVVAQGGDLAESFVKRRFGVKDASALIPGHGGLLDRVDGLMAAAAAFGLFQAVSGTEVLSWR